MSYRSYRSSSKLDLHVSPFRSLVLGQLYPGRVFQADLQAPRFALGGYEYVDVPPEEEIWIPAYGEVFETHCYTTSCETTSSGTKSGWLLYARRTGVLPRYYAKNPNPWSFLLHLVEAPSVTRPAPAPLPPSPFAPFRGRRTR